MLHRKLPVMEIGWAVDGVAVARDSTRWELRWSNEIGRRSESRIDSCTASKTAIALRGRRLFALTHCECKIGRRKMREGTSDCGRGRTMLAPAWSGVGGSLGTQWPRPPNICRTTRKVRQWAGAARLAGEGINSGKIRCDALRHGCRLGRSQRQGRSRRGCLLRRIDEGGRGASEDGEDGTYQEGTRSSERVGSGRVVRGGNKAFVKGGESDGRWRQKNTMK